jgi:hypothetical protein
MTCRRLIMGFAAAALLAGCATAAESAAGDNAPVSLKAVAGTDRFQVKLSPQAEQRLGIATDQVRAMSATTVGATGAAGRSTIPYAAVVYDSQGVSWTYTNVRPHVFVRAEITVERIDGDVAILTAGPTVGTKVVIVGSPELLGAEMQIAGEE